MHHKKNIKKRKNERKRKEKERPHETQRKTEREKGIINEENETSVLYKVHEKTLWSKN